MAAKGIELASAYISLSAETSAIPGQVRKALRGIKDTEVEVTAKVDDSEVKRWRKTEGSNKVTVKVDADTRGASKAVAKLAGELTSLGKVGFGAAGFAALPGLAATAANVAASLQQLAGAAAVVPGALAGVGAVAATAAIGLAGVEDAYKAVQKAASGSAKDIEAAQKALSQLAPSAREAVLTASQLQGQLKDALQLPVQQNLFEGLSDSARHLVDADLPAVQRGLIGISKALNSNAKQLFSSLGSNSSVSFLDRILGNTGDAQARLTKAIDPIVHAFGTLTAAGSDALPRLADGVDALADRFDKFITTADKDGSLAKWIDDGIDGFSKLGETALNIGKSFTAITKAAGTGGLLSTLESVTGKLQTFLNSSQGQTMLTSFFEQGKATLEKWQPILEDIPKLLPPIMSAAQTMSTALTGALKPIVDFLSDHPGLVEAAANAYLLFKGAAVLGSISTLISKLGELGSVIGKGSGPGATGLIGNVYAFAALVGVDLGFTIFDQMEEKARNAKKAMDEANAALHEQYPGTPIAPTDPVTGNGSTAPNNPLNPNGIYGPNTGQAPFGPGSHPGPPQTGGGGNSLPSAFDSSSQSQGKDGLYTQAESLKQRYSSWGFGNIGGYSGTVDQPWDEHQTGKAIDVMIPDWQGAGVGAGTSVLTDALRQPGTQHVIWRQKIYYPDGRVEAMPDRGSPTENHMDHVHIKTYDQGGTLPPGYSVVYNGTGQPELVLNPDHIQQMQQQGVDPNSVVHGTGNGAPPGPTGPTDQQQPSQADLTRDALNNPSGRTEGFIPATAGNTGVPGTSSLAGVLNMGNEVVAGLIDTGADLAKMAASAAVSAGTMGAGAAAGPAASIGIDMAASAAKRGVAYGFQMASIGADALVEQLFPFGAPRWLGYDYTQFVPQLGISSIATTTLEKAGQAAIQQGLNPGGGNGVDPNTTQHGAAAGLPPGPTPGQQPGGPVTPSTMPGAAAPLPPPGSDPFGTNSGGGAPAAPAAPAPQQQSPTDDILSALGLGLFDAGGVFPDKSMALNLSGQPEYVLTPKQWDVMQENATQGKGGPGGTTYNIYPRDVDEAVRQMRRKERLDMMQHSGRP